MSWISFELLKNEIHMKHHNVALPKERAFKSFMLESNIKNEFSMLPFGVLTKEYPKGSVIQYFIDLLG